jgi:NAD-dependent deacetylase
LQLRLAKYKSIVVLTGAGVSAASGIRTYRGPNGLWSEPDTAKFSSAEGFVEEPDLFWKFWAGMRESVRRANPNPAHLALAHLQNGLEGHQKLTLITQNVDELHQRAGSKDVVELHGSLLKTRCSNDLCKLQPFRGNEEQNTDVPLCTLCGAYLRPAIVLFGEAISAEAEWRCKRAFRECDLFIAVGTSGTVSPAASFVKWAKFAQAETVLVNLEEHEMSAAEFDKQIIGPAEVVLPKLFGVSVT